MATTKATQKTTKTPAKKTGITLSVFDITGKAKGSITLPKELFDAKVNETLMNQAVYVYLSNQRRGTVAQKTRGEVKASTRKIYRQKGTGRARHGALSAPIFVGGGVTFATKPREFAKKMSKKMKLASLASALTMQLKADAIKIVDIEKASGKTKEIATAFQAMNIDGKKCMLLSDGKNEKLNRAVRNIEGITVRSAHSANTYEVLRNKNVLITKEGLEIMKKHFLKENAN